MATAPAPTIVTGTRSMKLPTFSGGSEKDDLPPRDFVERIENYCKSLKKAANEECVEMQLALRGNATIWWRSLARRGINDQNWDHVKTEFLETYQPTMTGKTAHAIGQLEQKSNETVNDYFNRLDQVTEEMMEACTNTPAGHKATKDIVRNHIQRYLFIGGLRENIRTEVLKDNGVTLAEALKAASKTELILKRDGNKIFSVDEDATPGDLDGFLDPEELMAINNWRARKGRKPLQRTPMICYNCNKPGHISKNCTAPRKPRKIRSIEEEDKHPADETEDIRQYLQNTEINSLDFW